MVTTENIKSAINSLWMRIFLSLLIILVLILRIFFFDIVGNKLDSTSIILLILAIVLIIIPWENVISFKAAGIEVTLKKSVKGAIRNIGKEESQTTGSDEKQIIKRLVKYLSRKASELEYLKGSRILWIDDHPDKIVNIQRLLRQTLDP